MAGTVIRFGIGAPGGPRSDIWRLWTNPGKSDVYLASRDFAGRSKVSFHESGEFRSALTATPPGSADDSFDVIRLDDGTDPRMAHVWQRTDNAGPGGTLAFGIIVPAPDVYGPTSYVKLPEGIVFRPPPAPGFHGVMAVLFASPAAPMRDTPPSFEFPTDTMATVELENGDRVWVVTFDVPYRAQVKELIAAKRQALDTINARGYGLENRRAHIYGYRPSDDLRYVLDLALEVHPKAYGLP